jgi:hypothetical protein
MSPSKQQGGESVIAAGCHPRVVEIEHSYTEDMRLTWAEYQDGQAGLPRLRSLVYVTTSPGSSAGRATWTAARDYRHT